MTDTHLYLAWTIFADPAGTQVRATAAKSGAEAYCYWQVFKEIKGSDPQAGDVINGCRIEALVFSSSSSGAGDVIRLPVDRPDG